MSASPAQSVEMIPIDRVVVMNSRTRNQRQFQDIVDNIADVGLKRPITVTRRIDEDGTFYDLVCGQGRLEAFLALGQTEVPALVVSANQEDSLVASLVENCARRDHGGLDLLRHVGGMQQRGYTASDIAEKTGLSNDYVHAVLRLREKGEQRLLRGVESGQIPFSVALEIAEADHAGVQAALQSAYENNQLRGRKLMMAKRLVETRQALGRGLRKNQRREARAMSSEVLVRAFEEDANKKRVVIRRAEKAQGRLRFVVEAIRRLTTDQQFAVLLSEENLASFPQALAARVANLRADT